MTPSAIIDLRRPVSCRCGGDTAYVLVQDGAEAMLGCVCHTLLSAVVGLLNERLAVHG